ncbi:hypothetical protein ACFPRL_14815 [Pseudoclavibacter helvolus]
MKRIRGARSLPGPPRPATRSRSLCPSATASTCTSTSGRVRRRAA